MNWTPGPWEVIGRSIFQKDEVGGRGVLHGASVKGSSEDEIEANIRLISAAPELLMALNDLDVLVRLMTWSVDSNGYLETSVNVEQINRHLENSRAAIRKAKGE